MVRHDLPTPPPPTTTSLYSLVNLDAIASDDERRWKQFQATKAVGHGKGARKYEIARRQGQSRRSGFADGSGERGIPEVELVEGFKTTRGVATVRRRDGFPGWGFDRQREFLGAGATWCSRFDLRGERTCWTGLAMDPAINRPGQRGEFVG
jgi:hypothetical protein